MLDALRAPRGRRGRGRPGRLRGPPPLLLPGRSDGEAGGVVPARAGERGLGGGVYAESLATALAVHLLREHSSLGERTKRRVAREPKGGLSGRALEQALDHIGDNLSADLSLAGIAAAANASPYHFARLFKDSTGLSPHQYVIRERVGKAKGLLLETQMPLGGVARACGFASRPAARDSRPGPFLSNFPKGARATRRSGARTS